MGKIAKSGHLHLERCDTDTVKVHFAKIIEKQKKTPGHLKILQHYFETLRKVPV
jgi:hypothetical protein